MDRLKREVETNTGAAKQVEDNLSSLKELLGSATEKLRSFENKHNECKRTVDDLTAKQAATDRAIDYLTTKQETSSIQAKQAIDEVKAKQEIYQKQTNERLDEFNHTKAHKDTIPLGEGKTNLVIIYLISKELMVLI